jgi:hypothetical protein
MNVRFLNVEYIFNKIYYFFVNLFDGVVGIDFRFAGAWLSAVIVVAFIVLVIWIIYSKVRIFELDEEADAAFKSHFTPVYKHPSKVNDRWQKIEFLFESGNPNDWRVAIIEADSMLEELVISLGVPGEGLGERLRALSPQTFPTIQFAWEAHKVRNRIAHEGMNFNLTRLETDEARRNFERVFNDAGII